jgi:hypothetical protein
MGDSLNFVDSGIGERLHDGRIRSYPRGHRRHLVGDQTYPGQKNILAFLLLAGEGEVCKSAEGAAAFFHLSRGELTLVLHEMG